MRWLYKLRLRLRSMVHRAGIERELSDELRFHLEKLIEENIAQGMRPEEARYAALRELGGLDQIKEECRDMRRVNFVESLIQDIRYGLRQLRRSPGFTAVAVVTLALGIGANTAIFSVVNGVLLRPLPYSHPNRLVEIFSTSQLYHATEMAVSVADFPHIRRRARSIAQVALFKFGVMNLTGQEEPEQLWATRVAPDFFSVLGVPPAVGRPFLPEEGQPGKEQVVILGHALWQRRFGSDSGVLGRAVTLNGKRYVVVGVMPAGFAFPGRAEAWVPLVVTAEELGDHNVHDIWDIARLKGGTTAGQAQRELDTIAKGLAASFPEDKNWGLRVVPLEEVITGRVRLLLWLLLGAVGLVLLIACLNVANLVLARGSGRMREIALRQALGASRWRVVRQLLTESALVAAMGAAAGLLIGVAALSVLKAFAPGGWQRIPRLEQASLDRWVLAFTVFTSFASAIFFGLLPAFQLSRSDVNTPLKGGGAASSSGFAFRRGRQARGLLVSLEAALATVLLVGCGLLLKSFWRLVTVRTGLDTRNVLMMAINLPDQKYSRSERVWTFSQQVLERVRGLPGVRAAAFSNGSLYGGNMSDSFTIEGRPVSNPDERPSAGLQIVSADYFRALGIRLLKGRWFAESDVAGRPGVAIVNESFVRRFFPNEDALGKRIHIEWGGKAPPWEEIVGIAGDVRDVGLGREPQPEMYANYFQLPSGPGSLIVRTDSNPISHVAAIRHQVWAVDKDQPIAETATLDETILRSVAGNRFRTILLTVFAGLALLLTVVGVYGVVSYTVSQRTQEIGIRMTLGAERDQLVAMVIRDGMLLTLSGLALGLAGAFGLTRFLTSFLYQVRPTDTATFSAASLALGAAAVVACWIPARRAAKVDPVVALRYE